MLVMITNEDEVVFLLQYRIGVRSLERKEHKTKSTSVSHILDKNALRLKGQGKFTLMLPPRVTLSGYRISNAEREMFLGCQRLSINNSTRKGQQF